MLNFIQYIKNKYSKYFNKESIKLIENCFIISAITCLLGIFIFSLNDTYYISHYIDKASIIIYRTGVMIGLFPIAFTIIIENWKMKN